MALIRNGTRLTQNPRDPRKLQALEGLKQDPNALPPATIRQSTPAPPPAPPVTLTQRSTMTGPGGTSLPPPPPPGSDPYGDQADVSDMVGLKQRQEQERKAAQDEQAASKARALQNSAARSGIMGLGLSGGTSVGQTDLARQMDRTGVETMTALTKSQRDEQRAQEDRPFTQQQQLAALEDMEAADGKDYTHDGLIDGRPAAEVIKEQRDADELQRFKTTHPPSGQTHDVDPMNNDAPGSMNNPHQITGAEWDALKAHGATMSEVAPTPDGWRRWVDQDGVVYVVAGKLVQNGPNGNQASVQGSL